MAGELKVKASGIRILCNNLTLNFMEGSHEMELPEGANIQGSREILFSLGPFWSENEIFLKLTNFSSLSNKSKSEGGKKHV